MTGFPSTLLRFSLVKHHVIKYLLLVFKCLDLYNLNIHTRIPPCKMQDIDTFIPTAIKIIIVLILESNF